MNQRLPSPILPLARYRLHFQPTMGADQLASLRGQYLGSAWRGAFGHSLRTMVCVTRQPDCEGCPLLRSCPYPFIFESRPPIGTTKFTRYPRTPGPYVLVPSVADCQDRGALLHLGLTLFGSANDQFPYLIHALEKAGKNGLTRQKVTLELIDVEAEVSASDRKSGSTSPAGKTPGQWMSIYQPGQESDPVVTSVPEVGNAGNSVNVRLLSPLRLRRDNKPIPGDELTFRDFMSSLIRRISMLTWFFSPTPLETDFAALTRLMDEIDINDRKLKRQKLQRYSSRQRTHVPMDGLRGSFRVEHENLAPFWPYLWLGQWTHVGRGCTMGLGCYVLEFED